MIIVKEFHIEADVVRQRAEILHEHVKFAHKQRARFLCVVTGHFSHTLTIFAGNTEHTHVFKSRKQQIMLLQKMHYDAVSS